MIDGSRTATRSPSLWTRRQRKHKAAAWVVLSALLFNLAAGYVLPSSALAALEGAGVSDTATGGLFSDSMVICTPNGLRVVRFGPDGEPLPVQHYQDANCVFCLPFNNGQTGQVGAQALDMTPPSSAERITYPVYSLASSSGDSFDQHPIRAPPVFQ